MVKSVSFKEKETDLIKFIKDKDFSYYVKDLIRKDMQNNNEHTKIIEKTREPRRNTNFDI